ncbi:signal-regulatory protein beta-2-like isoform X2 [Scomber scombrus]|uniref:Signal-regulatory protein beta-2-like isoform X2 n=1 Tax=Scomber scombrus TaxID=13677 RepID=A0AAV1NZA5_SCOSC
MTISKYYSPDSPGAIPDITAVIQDFPSDPVRPGDSVTLQCSVFSDTDNKTCLEEPRVHWFRAGSDESHPSVIYTHGNGADECEKSPEIRSSQKCIYSFSKKVSFSDAGTYYCAVAICGEILFGNGTKLDIEEANMRSFGDYTVFLLCVALALSQIVIASLIYTIKKQKLDFFNAVPALQTNTETTAANQLNDQRDEDSLVYSVPNFTKGKAGRKGRRRTNADEGESIYADVRVLA